MQIAGFDVDDLADGSGKAHISWIGKELLKSEHMMNETVEKNPDGTYVEGTGSIGGWESSEMRNYLKETILPTIPDAVCSNIKEVTKTQKAYKVTNTKYTQTTIDNIWIPSDEEINSMTGVYNKLFTANARTIKFRVGETSANTWWLRNTDRNSTFLCTLTSGGNTSMYYPVQKHGVCLCFCT